MSIQYRSCVYRLTRMQLWKRYALAGVIFFTYSVMTLYIVTIERECPSDLHEHTNCPHHKLNKTTRDTTQGCGDPSVPKHQFEREKLTHVQLLDPHLAPNNVLYVWCGSRWFEFKHYLSVKSAINILKPDSIFFVYDIEPVMDFWMYNTWYKELKEEYPFFTPIVVKEGAMQTCLDFMKPNWDYIYEFLSAYGGIYLDESVMLDNFPLALRTHDFVYALHETSHFSLILAKKGVPVKQLAANPFNRNYMSRKLTCSDCARYVNKDNQGKPCVIVSNQTFPKTIWDSNTDFAKLARKHFYGTEEILRPTKSTDSLVPNIAHIVWIGGGQMDFLFFLGVVSLVYVAKVEVVYIHGELPPSGFYWETLKNHPRIKHVYRDTTREVFGQKIGILSHVTDVWRVDFMVNYGGIYIDTDVVFLRPLDLEVRQYDAMATYDWTYWNHPFPDTINFGVSLGKKGAKFWREFQNSMRWFVDNDWSWNGLRQPYRIQERHPDLLYVNPHLSCICYLLKCHPTWLPNYHNESYHHENVNQFTDWQKDVYAIHWTLPTPQEIESETKLLRTSSMFADIGKYILRTANILQDDNQTLVYPNGFTQTVTL